MLWIRLGLGSGSLSRWSLSGNGPLCKYRNFSKSLAAKYTSAFFSPLLLDLAANISSCFPCPCIHVSTQNEGYLPTVWKTPLLCLSLPFYNSKRNGFEELCSKLWHRLRHFIQTVQPSVSTCLIQKHRNLPFLFESNFPKFQLLLVSFLFLFKPLEFWKGLFGFIFF